MKSTSAMTFLATPWTVLAAIVVFCAVAVLSYIAWRRSGYRKSIALVEGLRLLIVALRLRGLVFPGERGRMYRDAARAL